MFKLWKLHGLQLRAHLKTAQFVLFGFVPWFNFLQQQGPVLKDEAVLKIGVSKTCKSVRFHFFATVARSEATRGKGLSNRKKQLDPNEAMLFVFNPPESTRFWMKDTLIPLQIAYFNPQGKLVELYEMSVEQSPANPKTQYSSKNKVSAALEVSPGTFSIAYEKQPHYLCVDLKN